MKILIIVLLFTISASAQTVYELTPGTKNNDITITLSNISPETNAEDVEVKVETRQGVSYRFSSHRHTVKNLDASKEKDVTFTFDVERSAQINTQDTALFRISAGNGVSVLKRFIFTYTAPKEYRLEQNFPNPFNPATTIQYQLPFESRVNIRVYNILGKEVAVLVDEVQSAGFKEIKFNGSDYASGVYIYKLSASNGIENYSSIKKMLMIK